MIDFLNLLISRLSSFVVSLLGFLPVSPIQTMLSDTTLQSLHSQLGFISHFVPVAFIVQFMTLYLSALILYFVYRVALRWARVIS